MKKTMKRLFAILLCIAMLSGTVPAAFALEARGSEATAALTVVNTAADGTVLSSKEYTAAALAGLTSTAPVGYQYWKNEVEKRLVSNQYVTVAALLEDAEVSFTDGCTLTAAAADGFNTAVTYEDLDSCRYFITEAGSTEVPASIAINWNTGEGSIEDLVAGATNSGSLRFAYGISEAQYTEKSAAGKRLVSDVVTVTVTQPEQPALTVYQADETGTPVAVKQYLASELSALATTGVAGYQYWKNGEESLVAAVEYVTIEALLADAGVEFADGDFLTASAADGFSSTVSYADLAVYKFYVTGEGSTEAPAALALSWDSGKGTLAEVAATAYNSGSIRFCYGISEAQYADKNAAGKRLVSGVISVTVTHCVHENTEARNAAEASCEENGYSGDTYCVDCGLLLNTGTVIAALGHAWDTGVVTTEPTATEKGVKTFTCTRCEATKTEEIPETGEVKLPFTDVPEGKWYTEAVKFTYANELFAGTSDTSFSPDGSMTRAMLVSVLWRLDGKTPAKTPNTFADVPTGQWYTEAISWAAENKLASGTGNGSFNPGGNVTREQIAVFIFNYAKYKQLDTSKTADLSSFPDSGKVSSWAKEALSWANAEGLISGSSVGGVAYLAPQGNATRAQVASILMRYVQNIVNAK